MAESDHTPHLQRVKEDEDRRRAGRAIDIAKSDAVISKKKALERSRKAAIGADEQAKKDRAGRFTEYGASIVFDSNGYSTGMTAAGLAKQAREQSAGREAAGRPSHGRGKDHDRDRER